MTEKKPNSPGEINALRLMDRVAVAMYEPYGGRHESGHFADAGERREWLGYALIALDEIAHTDPDELRGVLNWLMQTGNLPSIRMPRDKRSLQ
jgi:hypothetical protein